MKKTDFDMPLFLGTKHISFATVSILGQAPSPYDIKVSETILEHFYKENPHD
jgi:hypothetical protein